MRRLAILLAATMVIPLVFSSPASALTTPPGFDTSTVASGFTYPTSVGSSPTAACSSRTSKANCGSW